jgi:molybdate transport system substrate-binding protein
VRWAALLVLLTLAGAGSGQDSAITVSAAISLLEAFEDLAKAYAREGGGPVQFNFAGSNVLARQIVNGAPVDVFVSADQAQMAAVEKSGSVRRGGAVPIASNQLVVAALPERVDAIRVAFPSASREIRRLAIGDPAAVPAGVYAAAYLRSCGLWTSYESRIVPTANVRAALAAVENGGVDAAIVYATDVRQSTRARVAISIPPEQAPRIVYPAAVIEKTKNRRAAERFLAFLQSQTARDVMARHGFGPAGSAAPR